MKTLEVSVQGEAYLLCRPAAGAFTNKFNRAAKLAVRFDELTEKFDGMIERGGDSLNAQMAVAVKLLMQTGIRVGNESSAEGYITKPHPNSKVEPKFVQTYGLTTLQRKHFRIYEKETRIFFLGKKSVDNHFTITGKLKEQIDALLSTITGDDRMFDFSLYDLVKFIKRTVGKNFSPKDFRTMVANLRAYEALATLPEELPTTKKAINAEIKLVAGVVSEYLNNTPGVCKKNYIDDMFWELYECERVSF